MAFTYYKSSIGNSFNNVLIKTQYEVSKKRLNDAFDAYINRAKLSLKNNGVNDYNEEKIKNLLNDIQNNVLTKAAQQMTEKIVLPENQYFSQGKSFKDAAKSLGEILKGLKEAFKTIMSEKTLQELLKTEVTEAVANTKFSKDSKELKEIRDTYRNFTTIPKSFSLKINESPSSARVQKLVKNMIILQNMLNKYKNGGKGSLVAGESELIQSFIWSTTSLLRILLGFVSEDTLVDIVQGEITDELQKSFQGVKEISISAEKVGSKRNESQNVNTADISISLDLQKGLKTGNAGKIELKLPDISLKRTSVNLDSPKAEIKIKTKAKLDRFFGDGSFGNKTQDIIHFITAPEKKEPRDEKKKHTKDFFDYLKIAMFPSALAGNLTQDDFAYFFVINNRVYNVIDIITGAKDGRDLAKNLIWSGYTKIIPKPDDTNYWMKDKDRESYVRGIEVNLSMLSNLLNQAKYLTK